MKIEIKYEFFEDGECKDCCFIGANDGCNKPQKIKCCGVGCWKIADITETKALWGCKLIGPSKLKGDKW